LGATGMIAVISIAYYYRMKNKSLHYQQKELQADQKIYDLLLKERKIEKETRYKERERISRELHDGIVNKIFTVRLNLQRLESRDEELKIQLIEELVQATEQIRYISHDLQAYMLFENE